MPPAQPPYLLDTNILVALVRGGALGTAIDTQFSLRSSPYKPVISVVSAGELLSLARKFGWEGRKLTVVRRLLAQLVWIDINTTDIIEAYAELDFFSDQNGRHMGKNDLWIAATAKTSHTTLLTTDDDFDHLYPVHINRIVVDEKTGQPRNRP